jgi:hypothetical protein
MARSKPSGAMPHSFRGKLLLNQSTTRVTPHVLFLGTRGVSLISLLPEELVKECDAVNQEILYPMG